MQQLTAQNEDLAATVETLKSELIASNEEAERASRELETLRSRALHDSSQETFLRERELRELQAELEQLRGDFSKRERWHFGGRGWRGCPQLCRRPRLQVAQPRALLRQPSRRHRRRVPR